MPAKQAMIWNENMSEKVYEDMGCGGVDALYRFLTDIKVAVSVKRQSKDVAQCLGYPFLS
jgi:hypothetical protein